MDFANRGGSSRPTQSAAPGSGASTPQFKAGGGNNTSMDIGKASSLFVLIGTSVLVLALIFGLVFAKDNTDRAVNPESALINTEQYQAVFLDSQDGQVYFGKLAVYNEKLYVLRDIYYVRVENPIQPSDGTASQQANISLAKLGNELHAPEDVMYISRDQVLYWENLKDEGQVVSAITEYINSGGATQQQTTQPTGTNQQDDTAPAAETPTETAP